MIPLPIGSFCGATARISADRQAALPKSHCRRQLRTPDNSATHPLTEPAPRLTATVTATGAAVSDLAQL
jgi:hypothetical protein